MAKRCRFADANCVESYGIGPLDVDRFHGNSQHIFWVYPPEKDLVTFRHDTHAAADFFCHNVITAASKNYVRMV